MQRGFKITNILMDGQFACIRGNLAELQINLNICSNDEHVVEIKQLNHTLKEQVREIYNTLTFNNIPGRMIVDIAALVIFWINALPPSPYVGGNLIPRQIITGLTTDYTKHCRLQFDEYARVHKSHKNNMQEQTTGDIFLRPTGNAQVA